MLLATSLLSLSTASYAQRVASRAARSEYSLGTTIKLEGILASFGERTTIEATMFGRKEGDDGDAQEWVIDFGDTPNSELMMAGIILYPGVELVVTGNPHRNRTQHRVSVKTISMRDGSTWTR